MEKLELVYEGKSKRVYTTVTDGVYIQEFKDGGDAGEIPGKGACNNKISAAAFSLLEKNGVKTHFLKLSGDGEMEVKRLKILPLEVVCRNIAAGSLSKRLGLPEGETLPFCVVEFYLKNDALHAPLVNRDHIKIITKVTEGEVSVLRAMSLEINSVLNSWFESKDLVLVDVKLEFGVDDAGKIRLGDEISPDTCRLWDKTTHEKLDKDRFRRDLGGAGEDYAEVLRRVSGGTV